MPGETGIRCLPGTAPYLGGGHALCLVCFNDNALDFVFASGICLRHITYQCDEMLD